MLVLCGAETTTVGQWYLKCPSRISPHHSFIQVGGAAFSCAQDGTRLVRKHKREQRTVFNNEHLALKAQAERLIYRHQDNRLLCCVTGTIRLALFIPTDI